MLWFYKHWTIYLSKQLYFYEYLNDGEFYYKYTFCKLFVIIIYYFNNYNNSKIFLYKGERYINHTVPSRPGPLSITVG